MMIFTSSPVVASFAAIPTTADLIGSDASAFFTVLAPAIYSASPALIASPAIPVIVIAPLISR